MKKLLVLIIFITGIVFLTPSVQASSIVDPTPGRFCSTTNSSNKGYQYYKIANMRTCINYYNSTCKSKPTNEVLTKCLEPHKLNLLRSLILQNEKPDSILKALGSNEITKAKDLRCKTSKTASSCKTKVDNCAKAKPANFTDIERVKSKFQECITNALKPVSPGPNNKKSSNPSSRSNAPRINSPTASSNLPQACRQLQTKITASLGKTCTQKGFDKLADINKDKTINSSDRTEFNKNSKNNSWCDQKLKSKVNQCQSSPTPTTKASIKPSVSPSVRASARASSATASNCKDNPVNPPKDYKWKAACTTVCKDTAKHSDCPKSDDKFVNAETSAWCYGFTGGNRCMQLEYKGDRNKKPEPKIENAKKESGGWVSRLAGFFIPKALAQTNTKTAKITVGLSLPEVPASLSVQAEGLDANGNVIESINPSNNSPKVGDEVTASTSNPAVVKIRFNLTYTDPQGNFPTETATKDVTVSSQNPTPPTPSPSNPTTEGSSCWQNGGKDDQDSANTACQTNTHDGGKAAGSNSYCKQYVDETTFSDGCTKPGTPEAVESACWVNGGSADQENANRGCADNEHDGQPGFSGSVCKRYVDEKITFSDGCTKPDPNTQTRKTIVGIYINEHPVYEAGAFPPTTLSLDDGENAFTITYKFNDNTEKTSFMYVDVPKESFPQPQSTQTPCQQFNINCEEAVGSGSVCQEAVDEGTDENGCSILPETTTDGTETGGDDGIGKYVVTVSDLGCGEMEETYSDNTSEKKCIDGSTHPNCYYGEDIDVCRNPSGEEASGEEDSPDASSPDDDGSDDTTESGSDNGDSNSGSSGNSDSNDTSPSDNGSDAGGDEDSGDSGSGDEEPQTCEPHGRDNGDGTATWINADCSEGETYDL